jgi:hypothetical protein
MKPIIVITGTEPESAPNSLKSYLSDLRAIGCQIVFDARKNEENHKAAEVTILGLNPYKHIIPEDVKHYLKKLQKDYKLSFIETTPDEKYNQILKESGFMPELIPKILKV